MVGLPDIQMVTDVKLPSWAARAPRELREDCEERGIPRKRLSATGRFKGDAVRPRHRMPFNPRDEGSKCVGCRDAARQYLPDPAEWEAPSTCGAKEAKTIAALAKCYPGLQCEVHLSAASGKSRKATVVVRNANWQNAAAAVDNSGGDGGGGGGGGEAGGGGGGGGRGRGRRWGKGRSGGRCSDGGDGVGLGVVTGTEAGSEAEDEEAAAAAAAAAAAVAAAAAAAAAAVLTMAGAEPGPTLASAPTPAPGPGPGPALLPPDGVKRAAAIAAPPLTREVGRCRLTLSNPR